jgi:hypothetical protein
LVAQPLKVATIKYLLGIFRDSRPQA